MDPDGRQTANSSTFDDNVVRLPRDWLGPRDELIPFGASANGHSGPAVASASDFWGEESSSLQSALDTPPPSAADRRRLSGWVWCAGLTAVLLVVVVALLAAGDHARTGAPRTASVRGSASYLAVAARAQRALEATAIEHAHVSRQSHHPAPTTKHRAVRAPRHSSKSTVIIEQVRYVAAPAVSAPTQSSESAASPAQSTSSPQTSSASSNPSTGSVNQPAVGANGALGPGTSPDG